MCYSFDLETFILYELKHAHSCLLLQKDCSHLFTNATHKVAKLNHTISVMVHIRKVNVHQTHWKSFLRVSWRQNINWYQSCRKWEKKSKNALYKFLQILPVLNFWNVQVRDITSTLSISLTLEYEQHMGFNREVVDVFHEKSKISWVSRLQKENAYILLNYFSTSVYNVFAVKMLDLLVMWHLCL